jgi:Homeodomain-like domain
MVAAVRQGASPRAVAKQFRVSLRTVQVWVNRSAGQRLDRVDWSDRPRGGRRDQRATEARIEDRVVRLRQSLRDSSALGECGARAIHGELQRLGVKPLPSVRTIGRILLRRGLLDGRQRVRRPPPPPGWYLPRVAARKAELESFDFVEGLVIRGGTDVMVLNGITIHGGMCSSWVQSSWTAKQTVKTLIGHWQKHGLPHYAQFDNDTIFQGAHQWPDSFGRVTRLCLQLGVVPVFAPPRETGFQAAIESYNGRWQAKVWRRFEHDDLPALQRRSVAYVEAARARTAARRDAAPARMAFPADWKLDLQRPLQGTVIFIRRTNNEGAAELLGRSYPVDVGWPNRLVRAEVNLTRGEIHFYRLRRREPKVQTLAITVPYQTPTRKFSE